MNPPNSDLMESHACCISGEDNRGSGNAIPSSISVIFCLSGFNAY